MNSSDIKYKAAIFDIDGTLIDTERTGVLSLVRTIKELMGADVPYEDAYRYFGIPSSKVAGMLGYDGAEDFGEHWERNFIDLSHLIAPFPGVEEMLCKVKEAGMLTGLVTSRSRFEFDYDTHLRQLLDKIDAAVCSDDTIRHKPFPDPLLECMKRLGVEPSESLYLGDTAHDFSCATAAGCDFALADWHGKTQGNSDAKYVFTDARKILEILGCTHS